MIEQNTPSTRSFVCRLLILCTYRFPSFRRMLLEDMEELIPSRYHMDVDMVDLVVFRTSDSSVCNKYEDYMAHCNVSNDYAPGDISPLYYSSVSTVAEGNDRPSISRNSPFPHSKSRENLSAMGELSIPPPYVLRPLVECMDIDEEDGISKDAVDARKAFRKKNAHGSKMAADAADDDNPFSTSSTSSLLKKSLKNCIEEESSLNFRFPSLLRNALHRAVLASFAREGRRRRIDGLSKETPISSYGAKSSRFLAMTHCRSYPWSGRISGVFGSA